MMQFVICCIQMSLVFIGEKAHHEISPTTECYMYRQFMNHKLTALTNVYKCYSLKLLPMPFRITIFARKRILHLFLSSYCN